MSRASSLPLTHGRLDSRRGGVLALLVVLLSRVLVVCLVFASAAPRPARAPCNASRTCAACVRDTHCVWCEPTGVPVPPPTTSAAHLSPHTAENVSHHGFCVPGAWWGPAVDQHACHRFWRWQQCEFRGSLVVAAACGTVLLLGAALFCCLYCAVRQCSAQCARARARRRERERVSSVVFQQESGETRPLLQHPLTDGHRRELERKYPQLARLHAATAPGGSAGGRGGAGAGGVSGGAGGDDAGGTSVQW